MVGRSRHKYHFCHDESFVAINMSFVATKVCLSWQTFCREKNIYRQNNILRQNIFVATKLLSRKILVMINICHDKHDFVATKDVFCRDKSMLGETKLLSPQTCLSRQIFVTTNTILSPQKNALVSAKKCFVVTHTSVTTKLLSRQKYL